MTTLIYLQYRSVKCKYVSSLMPFMSLQEFVYLIPGQYPYRLHAPVHRYMLVNHMSVSLYNILVWFWRIVIFLILRILLLLWLVHFRAYLKAYLHLLNTFWWSLKVFTFFEFRLYSGKLRNSVWRSKFTLYITDPLVGSTIRFGQFCKFCLILLK